MYLTSAVHPYASLCHPGESGCPEKQWGKGESGNPAFRHLEEYGKKDSPRTEKSLQQLALNIGIVPGSAQNALRKAKAKPSPSADRVYFSCKGRSLVWYKPETE